MNIQMQKQKKHTDLKWNIDFSSLLFIFDFFWFLFILFFAVI